MPIAAPAAVAALVSSTPPASFLSCTGRPDSGYSRERQWDKVDRAIASDHLWKADQWVLLSAAHAEAVARLDAAARKAARGRGRGDAPPPLWRLLRRCTASDELLFPISLSLAGALRRPAGDAAPATATDRLAPDADEGLADRRLTFCDWSRRGTSPRSFDSLEAETVAAARDRGCLFARKFPNAVDVETWRRLVLGAKRARDGDDAGGAAADDAGGAGADDARAEKRARADAADAAADAADPVAPLVAPADAGKDNPT